MRKILSIVLGIVLSLQVFSVWQCVFANNWADIALGENVTAEWWGNDWKKWMPWNVEWSTVWLKLEWDCIDGVWKGCFEYCKLLWTCTENTANKDAFDWVQDAIYAATSMVWTVLVIVLLWCWFQYVMASNWDTSKASKIWWNLKNAAIWAILVWGAYFIVRLIQYIARW